MTLTLESISTFVSELQPLELTVVTLLVGFGVSAVVFFVSPFLGKKVYKAVGIEKKPLRTTREVLTGTAVVLTLLAALRTLPVSLGRIEDISVSVSFTLLILLWLWLAHAVGAPIIEKVVSYRYDRDMVPIVENVWTLLIIVFAVFSLFEAWSVDITPLLASAGVAGIVIGLAARETISNFFGSVALYADDTYDVGDYIEVNGSSGFVEDISIRSTRLRTLDDNIVTVPNSKLHKSMVKNKGAPTSSHRVEFEIGVSYDEDLESARRVIEETVEEVVDEEIGDVVDTETEDGFKVLLKRLDDSSVVFRIFVWIEEPSDEPKLRDEINTAVFSALEEHGIDIPFPQRSLHIRQDNSDSMEDDTDG